MRRIEEIVSRIGQRRPGQDSEPGATRDLPEPLRSIDELLQADNAPTEFVSSGKLAIVLGRVAPDASEDDIAEAGARLAKELSLLVPGLTTKQKRTAQGRPRGYYVARLRAAANAVRRSEDLPPEDAE